MNNKRGQGLSTSTIILLILGIFVLVILILGFTMGWGRLAPWLSGDNVDTIVNSCESACSTAGTYAYCTKPRELKADETLKDVTCNYLSQRETQYGVSACSSVNCDSSIKIVDLFEGEMLEDLCLGNEDKIVQALVGDTLESFDCKTLEPASEETQ